MTNLTFVFSFVALVSIEHFYKIAPTTEGAKQVLFMMQWTQSSCRSKAPHWMASTALGWR